MRLRSFLQKLRRLTPQEVWGRFREGLWSTDSILLLTRPAGPPGAEARPFAGELRIVTEKDLSDCAAFEDAAHYVPVYRDMLRRGDFVLFGYLDGACVFRHCLQLSGPFSFKGHPVRDLAPNEAYVHYGYCAPNARGNGFHQASLSRFPREFPTRTLYALVKEDNEKSLRGCFRTGYRPYSRLTAKSRFFHSSCSEVPLTAEEVDLLTALVRPENNSVDI